MKRAAAIALGVLVACGGCASSSARAPASTAPVEYVGQGGAVTQWLRLDLSAPGRVGFRIEARAGARVLAHAEGTAWIAAAAAEALPDESTGEEVLLEPYVARDGDCYVQVRLSTAAARDRAAVFMQGCWDTDAVPWDTERLLRRQ